MKKTTAAALVCSAMLVAAPAFAAAEPGEREKIEQVVETFRVSIIKKDADSFMKLFYSDTIPWIGVTTDKSLARENANKPKPDMPDEQKISAGGSPRKFIEGIVKRTDMTIEEKFDNVRIDSDGDVAQVWFDYSFNRDDYKSNWGKEAWHLVRTDAGWKISSVIWSMEFNPEPPPKVKKNTKQ
ncbi:hypothetical protein [Massilia sp. TSP1-1-2]|uniref:hypothetical protein n=1 Tax=Massilia sp. TSP1-1-2 TaxID=2804649 RepID=UPI003CE94C65